MGAREHGASGGHLKAFQAGDGTSLDTGVGGSFHGAMGPKTNAADYESTPISRSEYIMAIVHLYRGELYRATSWRIRLDNTTNWAVLSIAGLLSISFGGEGHTHFVLLLGFALVSVFWIFEARRYRFSDIWYARVRMIEENFYGPILRRDPSSPESHWGALVAEDMFTPRFKISRRDALRNRFLRNYWAIYLVLLFCWVVKLLLGTEGWAEVGSRLEINTMFPWWVPILGLVLFFTVVAYVVLSARQDHPEEDLEHSTFAP
jgi:uncharacterized membrane protein